MTENIPETRFNPMTSLAKLVGPLDGRGNLPLYQELQRALRKAIDGRILGPDDALPSERDLAADFAVSRITVRKALDGLVADGLLVRRQGAGNFVSARVDKNFAMLTSFSEDMRARGRTPRSVWLKRAAGTVTPEEALALRLSPGTPVFRFNRIRYADDAPKDVMDFLFVELIAWGAAAVLAMPVHSFGRIFEDLKHIDGRRAGCHTWVARRSCTERTALDPSPTAAATRFIEPLRTSPAANTPGTEVSNGNGLVPAAIGPVS